MEGKEVKPECDQTTALFRSLINKNGYRFKYENDKIRLYRDRITLICPNGHDYKTSFSRFKGSKNRKGARCPKCRFIIKNLDRNKLKESLDRHGVKIHDIIYDDNLYVINIECPICNNIIWRYLKHIYGAIREKRSICGRGECTNIKRAMEYRIFLNRLGYELLEEWGILPMNIIFQKKMLLKCPIGHLIQRSPFEMGFLEKNSKPNRCYWLCFK